jgi:hypothetical protein
MSIQGLACGRQRLTTTQNLCVVHLVRHANGWEPFDRFMRSYEENQADVPHDLVAACKGFPNHEVPLPFRERLAAHGGTFLALDDQGFDIGSYWAAARALDYESFCFLNSFSLILDPGWLAKMVQKHDPQVGIIGASGSWGTNRSGFGRLLPALLLPPGGTAPPPFPPRRMSARDRAWLVKEYLHSARSFPSFPNPHIRTNAFLMRRDLMMHIQVGELSAKWDALAFESGRNSLTRQVLRQGLQALVVGRDGRGFPPQAWEESHTFRSGDQANLLVADNRTLEWAAAPSQIKERQVVEAWGWPKRQPPWAAGDGPVCP